MLVQARSLGLSAEVTPRDSGQAWSLGPAAGPSVVEGVGFRTLAPDGRLASVVEFIDMAPA